MTELRIRLLGTFQVARDERPVSAFRSDKTRVLLAYLAVEADRPHRREALVDLLWPGQSRADGLTSLRQAVWRLRRCLGDDGPGDGFLVCGRHDVQVNPASVYWVDVSELLARSDTCLAHHPAGGVPCDDCLASLTAAVALYRGPFLTGLSPPVSAEFDDWLITTQEELHWRVLELLDLLGRGLEARGDYAHAELLAHRELELEPVRESAYRRLMRALALSGQRGPALQEYAHCQQLLLARLGIEPARETTELRQRIASGLLAPSPDPVRSADGDADWSLAPGASPGGRRHFVGFAPELAQLERHVDHVLAGDGRAVVVTGEAGSGKTMLMAELCRRAVAGREDLLVGWGAASAVAGLGDPYQPFREVLRMLVGEAPQLPGAGGLVSHLGLRLAAARADLQAVLAEDGPDVVPMLLAGRSPTGDKAASWQMLDASRARAAELPSIRPQSALFDQLTRVLYRLAARYPLVLVLDDLHWADSGSVALLHHLGRRLSRTRILVLAAVRPEGLLLASDAAVAPLAPVLGDLMAADSCRPVDLDQADRRAFVDALLDRAPNKLDEAFRASLVRRTSGNPLFTVAVLHDLVQCGGLVRDGSGCWVAGPELDWTRVPPRVEGIVAERLGQLPAPDRRLLEAASVQGEAFRVDVAAGACGLRLSTARRRLEGSLSHRHRLVRGDDAAVAGGHEGAVYRFRHVLLRQCIYDRLDPAERAHLHAATGLALEAQLDRAGDRPNTVGQPARLAWHFEQAGHAERAARYCLWAGEVAYRSAALPQAIAHFERGLRLIEPATASVERDALELALRMALAPPLRATLGHAHPTLGRLYARMVELSEVLGDDERRAAAMFLLSTYHLYRGELPRALDIGRALMEDGPDSGGSLRSGSAYLAVGAPLLLQGAFGAAESHLDQIAAPVVPSDAPREATPLATNIGLIGLAMSAWPRWFLGHADQALARADAALTAAERVGHPIGRALTLGIGGCVVRLLRRECGQVRDMAAQLQELAALYGFQAWLAWAQMFAGCARVDHGDVAGGLADLDNGLVAYRATGQRWASTLLLAMQAQAYLVAGDPERGLVACDEALALMSSHGERFCEAEIRRLQGELLLLQAGMARNAAEDRRDVAAARGCFERAGHVARRQGARALALRIAVSRARVARDTGDDPAARSLLQSALDALDEGDDTLDVQEARAHLAGRSGRQLARDV